MTSTRLLAPLLGGPSDHVPPRKPVGTAIRKTLAREEKLYHSIDDQKFAQGIQREDAESSAD